MVFHSNFVHFILAKLCFMDKNYQNHQTQRTSFKMIIILDDNVEFLDEYVELLDETVECLTV